MHSLANPSRSTLHTVSVALCLVLACAGCGQTPAPDTNPCHAGGTSRASVDDESEPSTRGTDSDSDDVEPGDGEAPHQVAEDSGDEAAEAADTTDTSADSTDAEEDAPHACLERCVKENRVVAMAPQAIELKCKQQCETCIEECLATDELADRATCDTRCASR